MLKCVYNIKSWVVKCFFFNIYFTLNNIGQKKIEAIIYNTNQTPPNGTFTYQVKWIPETWQRLRRKKGKRLDLCLLLAVEGDDI